MLWRKLHSCHSKYIHLALLVCLLFNRISDFEGSEIRLYFKVECNSLSSCKNTKGTGFVRSINQKQ